MSEDLVVRGVDYVIDRKLLDHIDLTFRAGQLTALSGPSGSGKTSLLSIAGGLIKPTAGSASYAGKDMWQGTGDPRGEVAFVLQVYGLIPILSALENVSVALRARGVTPAEADRRAGEALARFHIADLGDRQVEELSGGQMQRVACARGFVVEAGVLLADEPTSELDEVNREMVLGELRKEAERGAVVVVATHDPAVVAACDAHYLLDEGRLVDHIEEVHLGEHAAAVGHDPDSDPVPVAQSAGPTPVVPPAGDSQEHASPRHRGGETVPETETETESETGTGSGTDDDWAFRRPADRP